MDNRVIIEEYLKCSIEELESTIGRILIASEQGPEKDNGLYTVNLVPKDEKEITRLFIARIQDDLRQKICIEWQYKEKMEDDKLKDNTNLVLTIADIIAGCCGHIPPFMLASLLLKMGLNTLCEVY